MVTLVFTLVVKKLIIIENGFLTNEDDGLNKPAVPSSLCRFRQGVI